MYDWLGFFEAQLSNSLREAPDEQAHEQALFMPDCEIDRVLGLNQMTNGLVQRYPRNGRP